MGKGQNKSGKKHKSINLPKRRCQIEGCNKLAKNFIKDDAGIIKQAYCNKHRK